MNAYSVSAQRSTPNPMTPRYDLINANIHIYRGGRCEEDVKRRIGLAYAAFGGRGALGEMWRERVSPLQPRLNSITPWYSAGVIVRFRMLESEARGLTVSGRDEYYWLRRIRGRSPREKKSEMNKQDKSLGFKKQWYKRSRKEDYSGLDMWDGWRGKDYQTQLHMDMWREEKQREAEDGQ